jgi:glycosyltransferase involved in cell wall biosynthesis
MKTPRKIGIDARFWSESGVGRYLRNLVFELAKIDQENTYYIFLLKKNLGQNLPENFIQIEAEYKWYGFAEQFGFLKLLNKHDLDLMHFPHFNHPVFYKKKYVVTIHDLIHQHFQMKRVSTHGSMVYKIKHLAYDFALKRALKKSRHIITVSEYVKKELVEKLNVNRNKISVTYEAAEENIIELTKMINKTEISKTLKKFNINPPFIFYVGNAHPHKNVEGLIKTFLKLRKNYQ